MHFRLTVNKPTRLNRTRYLIVVSPHINEDGILLGFYKAHA